MTHQHTTHARTTTSHSRAQTAAPAKTAVALRDVTFRYGREAALGPLDLNVGHGEFVCVVGQSGSGKSTLLGLLAGFLRPDGGHAEVAGAPLRGPSDRVTLMQQEHALFPWRTVLGNVTFGLERAGVRRAEREAQALQTLERVGIADLAGRRVHELSGGQRQRVALARALALKPDVLLLDEPFSALDVNTRHDLADELLRLWREQGMTVVFVTHHLEEAVRLGGRVVAMQAGRVTLDQPADRTSEAELRAALS